MPVRAVFIELEPLELAHVASVEALAMLEDEARLARDLLDWPPMAQRE